MHARTHGTGWLLRCQRSICTASIVLFSFETVAFPMQAAEGLPGARNRHKAPPPKGIE